MHQEHETLETQTLGRPDAPCAGCGAPLAHDQRYCLNCGARRADAREPFRDILERRAAPAATGPVATPPERWQPTPLFAGTAVALLALAVAIGVLIGSTGDHSTRQVAAPAPQVITVAGAAAAAPVEEFQGDWPDGKGGYTVQLRTLPKDGTQVAAVQSAKSDATSQGATGVGALDSDDFASLDEGKYVIYAGVFESRKRAKKELRKLKADFAGARIIQVSTGGGVAEKGDAGALSGKKKEATVGKNQLKELQGLTPEQYQKKAKKLPDTTKLPGKAPKKDNKKPGGGGEGDVIE